jgi:hypothetical protein
MARTAPISSGSCGSFEAPADRSLLGRRAHTVRFTTLPGALADLLRLESIPAIERRLRRYTQPDLLVLDDLVLAGHEAIFEGRVVAVPEPPPPMPGPDAGYEKRLAALQAQIDALMDSMSYQEVRFEVLRSWKGAAGQAVVRTPGQRTACGYPFAMGRTYLVFAHRGEDGALWANACGRTRPDDEAARDRAVLDAYTATVTTAVAPPRAGCAGCATAPDGSAGGFVGLALALVAGLSGRSRWR